VKKSELLNSDLSYEISKMGHTQTILIGDCGLPIPSGVKRIDLAVKRGVPSFADILETVLSELCVEKYIVAEELHFQNAAMEQYIKKTMGSIPSEVVSHEELKKMYTSSKLIFEQEGSNNFLKLLAQILIVNAMAGSLIALYNLYLLDNPIFQLSFSQSLLVLQTTLVLAMIAASLTPNDYFSRLSLNQLTLWAALTMILLAVSNFLHLPVFVGIAFGFLLAYISGKINPKINTLLLSKLPSDVLAQTSSFLSLLFSFSVPFGTMVFSSLALWNMNASWLIFSIIGVIALLLSIEKKKDIKER